jgi:hypothetical protein
MPPMREPRKPPTPWLFSLLILPLGIVVVGSKPLNLDAVATKLGDFLTKTGEDNPRRRHLPMRSTWFAVSLLLLSTSLSHSQMRPEGRVTGTVLDEFSQPIDKAQVCRVVYLPSKSDATCFAHTDKTGQFEIDHVPMGTYGVVASKNEDGYADFGLTAPVKVTLTPEEPLANVIVKLGPRAGILIPRVRDKVTGTPLPDFFLKWRVDVPDGTWTGTSGFSQWTTRTSIPAAKDVSFQVSAPGYQTWVYTDPSNLSRPSYLRLESGEQKSLSIELQPEAKNTPTPQ